jgi:hypothetical protein
MGAYATAAAAADAAASGAAGNEKAGAAAERGWEYAGCGLPAAGNAASTLERLLLPPLPAMLAPPPDARVAKCCGATIGEGAPAAAAAVRASATRLAKDARRAAASSNIVVWSPFSASNVTNPAMDARRERPRARPIVRRVIANTTGMGGSAARAAAARGGDTRGCGCIGLAGDSVHDTPATISRTAWSRPPSAELASRFRHTTTAWSLPAERRRNTARVSRTGERAKCALNSGSLRTSSAVSQDLAQADNDASFHSSSLAFGLVASPSLLHHSRGQDVSIACSHHFRESAA